jgi:Tol biopolymer transport system component
MDITSAQSISADIGPLPGTEGSLSLPVWLLGGQKVLVTLPLKPGVWMVDLDGNVERLDEQHASRRTTRSKGLSVPHWDGYCDGAVASPDGNYVVYTAGQNWMYLIDLRTQSVVDLGRGELCYGLDGIEWAPTEPQFLRWVKKIHPLELVHAQDGSTRQLAPDGQWPAWSPDGQQMVYMDDDQLWSVCLDSISSERPTYISPSDPEKRRWGAPYNYNVAPQWSPDGSAIAFVAFLGDHPEAYLLELEEKPCSTGSGSD